MITTQYKILLPSDYDMNIIKERVTKNGHKTDGFDDLVFKLYLITEKGINHNLQNSYSPLYLWKNHNGLNKFLFEGYYDNILTSFGWQQVQVRIPLIDPPLDISSYKYLFHLTKSIPPQESLCNTKEEILENLPIINNAEYMLTYNPDKWEYDVFYFLDDVSNLIDEKQGVMYTILHISH
ncbi:DUF4865 family protein [Neobacillus niacini]|uniref:DUF4865 family protein n=1 Tax=Neobacillus niacini TaxID=86668 RepID=UPI0007AC0393|nr:DUF4865 family protein [Neobacillus niacini]MEC1525446.1 DUF4865 family protein [Neobacillus niacini]